MDIPNSQNTIMLTPDTTPALVNSGNVQQDLAQAESLKKRLGMFTGSPLNKLMSCSKLGKSPWSDPAKLYDFGTTATKYIFGRGKSRETGIDPRPPHTPWQMRWGIYNEPLIVEKLLEDGVITNYEKCYFTVHKTCKTLGATPDGLVLTEDSEEQGAEIKSTVSWDGFYDRMYEEVHEKHQDFWQVQAEMMVLDVPELLYVTALPMSSDKYEYNVVKASEMHQKVIIKRIEIAELTLKLWTSENTIKQALALACAQHKEGN